MENLVPEQLWQLLTMAVPLSILVMSTLQRAKQLPFIKHDLAIWIANLVLSFALGIPYYLLFLADVQSFGDITLHHVLMTFWLSMLTFIGAPMVYALLREQSLINLQPKTLAEIKNEIFTMPTLVEPIVPEVKEDSIDTVMGNDA